MSNVHQLAIDFLRQIWGATTYEGEPVDQPIVADKLPDLDYDEFLGVINSSVLVHVWIPWGLTPGAYLEVLKINLHDYVRTFPSLDDEAMHSAIDSITIVKSHE